MYQPSRVQDKARQKCCATHHSDRFSRNLYLQGAHGYCGSRQECWGSAVSELHRLIS